MHAFLQLVLLWSFAEQQDFPFELWSDDDKTLAIYYGAASASSSMAGRVSVILDSQGRLVNRLEAVAHVGSAALDNEECSILVKMMRAMGLVYIEHQARI